MTWEDLENRMTVLLGGRATEFTFFKHLSTDAADDPVRATDIARSLVCDMEWTRSLATSRMGVSGNP